MGSYKVTVDNAVLSLAFADLHSLKKMKDDFTRFIVDNAEEIMSTPSWGLMTDKLRDDLILKVCVRNANQVGEEAQDGDGEVDEEDYINSLTVDNAVLSLAFADAHSLEKMKDDVSRFILDNAEEITSTPSWGHMTHKLKDELFLKACVGNRKRSFASAFRG
jgi:hypothetical protein